MTSNIIVNHVTNDIDLIYSPDDHGYYLQRYSTDETSPIFFSKAEIIHALNTNQIEW